MDPRQFLTTEITLLKRLTGTTCTWINFSTLVISFLFHIVAFSTNGWLTVEQNTISGSVTREVGLWQECHEDLGCRYFGFSDVSAGFRVVQAFVLILFLGGFGCLVCMVGYVMSYDVKRETGIITVVTAIRAVLALILVVTVAVFSAHWSPGLYEGPSFSGSLQYSFALESFCLVLEVVGVAFGALELCLWMKQVDDY